MPKELLTYRAARAYWMYGAARLLRRDLEQVGIHTESYYEIKPGMNDRFYCDQCPKKARFM